MYILGISAFYHDSSATLIKDGSIIAAAQEERFSRIKNDENFPEKSVAFCLNFANISIDDLSCVVFYDKPFLKFERILETYISNAPKGLKSFLRAMPIWLKQKILIKKIIREKLSELFAQPCNHLKILFPDHHLSHAASAFFPSTFEESAIITIDGVGEWATASIMKAEKNKITILKEMQYPNSIGLLYSAFTYYLGFEVNSGEYKLMGLAPYGNADSGKTAQFIQTIKSSICNIFDDGSVFLYQKFFTYATELKMVDDDKWEKLFNIKRRRPDEKISQEHCDLALAIQKVTEECVLKMAMEARKLTGSDNLCMAGGVALNCAISGQLIKSGLFKEIFIQPAAGDAGGSLGAALAANYIYFNKEKVNYGRQDGMSGTYLGPEFSNYEIKKICNRVGIVFEELSEDLMISRTADHLMDGEIIGWFQGRMEFGPRALGNRSILADPRVTEMQNKLNLKIKFRESFRPFAPSVPVESMRKYFEMDLPSPYMLFVYDINSTLKKKLPLNFDSFTLEQKRDFEKSELPAITHIDFSSRVQSVDGNTNLRFWKLLKEFESKTGSAVLCNTSFNVKDEPIVCTPIDAIQCFFKTEMDVLIMNNIIVVKKSQPDFRDSILKKLSNFNSNS